MPWFTKQRNKKVRNTSEVRILVILASFKADLGLFRPYKLPADTARFWLNHLGLARIEAYSAWIELRWRESSWVGVNPKKKKLDAASTRGQPCRAASDAGAAPSQLHPCFLDHIQHVIQSRDRKTIFHSDLVDGTTINTHPPSSVFLWS